MKYRIDLAKLFKLKIIKFLGAGALNTLFGYCFYAALLFIDVSYLLALFFATVAGIIFNYFSFGKIVFSGLRSWTVFVRFIAAYVMIYAVNAALLKILTQYYYFDPYTGQILCIPIGIVLSWVLMNYWVYKND